VSPRPAHLALSAAGWLTFNAVVLWTMGFLAGRVVPWTVDGPARLSRTPAVTVDLALLLLFAVQHSVMARRQVKAWMRRRVPFELERTTYVLATNACLALLLAFWQPFGGQVWRVHGPGAIVLWVLCGAGWALAIASTYAVDHLELTGLRQAGWAPPRLGDDVLAVGGLYRFTRHPLMTGMLIAFWATPQMGAGHLTFAAASTCYIVVGVGFEERDLRRTFGFAYDEYAARVPAVVPGWGVWRRSRTFRELAVASPRS
jgi:protein-S-isoprenylcysteine O-methyltransferase Ste14